MPSTDTIRARNLAVLADALNVPLLESVAADHRFLLLGDVSGYLAREPKLVHFGSFKTRAQALASVHYDGINPLPVAVVDLDAGAGEDAFTVLTYDPVRGMAEADVFALISDLEDDESQLAAQHYAGLVEDIRWALGHYEY